MLRVALEQARQNETDRMMTDQPADPRLELTVDDIMARAAAIAIALPHFNDKGRDHNQQHAMNIATFVMRLGGPN
jgi:hypothetical protein